MKLPITTAEILPDEINVGVTSSGMVRLQIAATAWCLIRPDTALRLSRDLMRMAFILEPPAAPEEKKP